MINLKEFLESDKSTITKEYEGGRYSVSLAKMYNYEKNIISIFKEDYCKGNDFNPFSIDKDSLLGIYFINNKVFYFKDTFKMQYSNLNLTDLEYSNLNELNIKMVKEINNKIIEKINNDESKLNVNLNEMRLTSEDYLKGYAESLFLGNKNIEVDSYASYSIPNITNSFDTLVDYVENKEKLVDIESDKYIENKKNDIYLTIVNNKKIKEYMKVIENNVDYIRTRELNKILSNKDYKTVNIKYKQGNNEMKFKIEARDFLSSITSTINSYKIQPSKDRETFMKTFESKSKCYADIEQEYIEEITYGRNLLYKKNA